MNSHRHPVEEFSEAYFMFNGVDVREYTGDQVAVPEDLMRELGGYVSAPLIKLSTGHQWLGSEWGIPADTLAVPKGHRALYEEPLLAKDHTVKSLLHNGVVEAP